MNGGTNSSSNPSSATYGSTVTLTNPTKTVTVTGNANSTGATVGSATSKAQTFSKWTVSGTGSSISGTTLTMGSVNATLTANWAAVAFNLPTVTKTGYTCKWNTSSDGTGTSYNSGASYTPSATSSASITMYAVCTVNTFKVSYDANGGTGAPSSQTKTYGVALTLSSTAPTRTGYTFLGWSTDSAATSATYSAGGTFTTNADTTLYAVWEMSFISSYQCANTSSGSSYNFVYTGNCTVIDDGDGNWRIKFLTSGTLTINNLGNASSGIDVFLVGGGGGGGQRNSQGGWNGGGGGGGYTKTVKGMSISQSSYTVTIGAGGTAGVNTNKGSGQGGSSSFNGQSVSGGKGGTDGYFGGNGGSGGSGGGGGTIIGGANDSYGAGGTNGGNGTKGGGDGNYSTPGSGQETTTREFGESSGTLYSSGGSGGVTNYSSTKADSGSANTGDGGGGGAYSYLDPGSGGSGIVIIRNKR